jgi:predicted HD phosphohydrolase
MGAPPTIDAVSAPSTDPTTLAQVMAVLHRAGWLEEPNEEIAGLTILDHGLQCAELLRRSDPDDPELQVAGLLHDLGHVLEPGCEDVHGVVAAEFVRPVFGDRVAGLIEGHVPAKRYLVATDRSYRGQLSEGSLRTLVLQGEAMTPDEASEFRSSEYAQDALRLRRADEGAKLSGARVPGLDAWTATLDVVAG